MTSAKILAAEGSPLHTPEPWEACRHGDYGDYDGQCIVVLGDDTRIAVVLGRNTKTTRANARLIAAAPNLLTMVERFLADYVAMGKSGDCGTWSFETDPIVVDARALIAKLKGNAG